MRERIGKVFPTTSYDLVNDSFTRVNESFTRVNETVQ